MNGDFTSSSCQCSKCQFYPLSRRNALCRFVPLSQSVSQSVSPFWQQCLSLLYYIFEFWKCGLFRFGRFVRVRLISIDFSCFRIRKARSPTTRMIWIMDNLVPPQNMLKLSLFIDTDWLSVEIRNQEARLF